MDIFDPDRRLSGPALTWLAAMSRAAAAAMGALGEVRVRIVGDAEMDAAHRRYMGIAGTTDVLTFDLSDGNSPDQGESVRGAGRTLDTDILICADVAARQAADRGDDLTRELLLYIVHGMLHCLGYDDLTPDDAAAMHRREDEVLTAIGVGPVFAAAKPGPGELSAPADGAAAAGGATWA